MEYNRIYYFLKAAQTLNFTKAAEALFISRQALTKQINLLEEELGVVLFERNTRKVVLTSTGQEAYKQFMRATFEMEKAMKAVRSLGENHKTTIHIGFFNDLQRSIINNITRYIEEEFPNIMMEPMVYEMFDLRNMVTQGKLDLCITNSEPGEGWNQCEKLVLGAYPPQVYVSIHHPWALKSRITVEDMQNEDFIMLKDERVDLGGFYENIPCHRQVWMPNLDSVLMRLEQGKGFAMGLKYSNSFSEKMVAFSVPGNDVLIEMSCFWNKENKNDYVQQIVELLSDIFLKEKKV